MFNNFLSVGNSYSHMIIGKLHFLEENKLLSSRVSVFVRQSWHCGQKIRTWQVFSPHKILPDRIWQKLQVYCGSQVSHTKYGQGFIPSPYATLIACGDININNIVIKLGEIP